MRTNLGSNWVRSVLAGRKLICTGPIAVSPFEGRCVISLRRSSTHARRIYRSDLPRIPTANRPRVFSRNAAFQPVLYGNQEICEIDPYAPSCLVNAGNVTAAFHFLTAKNEFYVVYGNANNLYTESSLFLKWIRYIGAPKGT
jgi:hypothetical protein